MPRQKQKLPSWLQHHRGIGLVGSREEGQVLQRRCLAPILALIAIRTGKPEGDLFDLEDLIEKLVKGEAIYCRQCQGDIYTTGHTRKCALRKDAQEVLSAYGRQPWRGDSSMEKERLKSDLARERAKLAKLKQGIANQMVKLSELNRQKRDGK